MRLTKREAIDFLGFDDKKFDNYFRNACEFECLERVTGKGRFYFDNEQLERWLEDYNWRTVELDMADYQLCLDFALAMHFRGYTPSDFGSSRQREFGQKITNWVKGQLAEVAVKKFFENEFGVEVELDFNIHEDIVPQDIIGVLEEEIIREPNVGIGIKASKPKSAYLILGENEVNFDDRRSDYYIFCRPDIPDDHLIRIARNEIINAVNCQPHFNSYEDLIPFFESIPCEIAGYCTRDELRITREIPGQSFDSDRYVRESGLLHRSREEWQILLNRI